MREASWSAHIKRRSSALGLAKYTQATWEGLTHFVSEFRGDKFDSPRRFPVV